MFCKRKRSDQNNKAMMKESPPPDRQTHLSSSPPDAHQGPARKKWKRFFSSRLHLHLLACDSVAPSRASRSDSRARLGSRYRRGMRWRQTSSTRDSTSFYHHSTICDSKVLPIGDISLSIARSVMLFDLRVSTLSFRAVTQTLLVLGRG